MKKEKRLKTKTQNGLQKIVLTTALAVLVLAAFTAVGSAAILSEGFETSVPPTGWTEEIVNDPGTDPDWSQVASGSYPTCSPHEGSYMAKFNSYNCPSDASARLYTSEMSFSGLSGVELKFWMYHDDGYSTKNERITVQGSTDGSTWTDLTTFNRYDPAGDFWDEHTVDLSAYNDESSVWIAFLGISDYGNNMYIDEVEIGVPPCLVVDKKVYNGTDWIDEISGAELGNIYRFRINATSSCCDFTNVTVTDTLSSSLAYNSGSASPFEPTTVGNVHYWNFSALNEDETITIEFNVSVSAYGYDCNVANVTANCTDTGVIHSAEDDACVNTPSPGDDCTDPLVVSISGDLTYTDTGQTTCGRGNDYSSTCLGSYDDGEDIIYRLDVTADTTVDITMDPKGTGWTGICIDDVCPPGNPCMAKDTGSSGTRTLACIDLTAGNSYYIMVDTNPAPDCIPDFDLTITENKKIKTVHPTDPAADYTTIQDAIDAACDGGSIEVWNSIYNENVVVDKRLTIYSRDGADVTIVDGGDSGHVFKVEVDRVSITGFTVTNSGSAGIYVRSDHNNITGNTVNNNNGHGVDMDGDNNNVTDNTMNNNDGYGITLYGSDYNNIMDNIVSNNGESGIFLSSYCSDNVVSTNTITNNGKIGTWSKAGIRLKNADDNEIVCNLVAYNVEKGFYLHGGSTGNNISCNNIVANGVYNAATGGWEWNFHNEQNDNNIDADDNYWCTDEASVKNAGIKEDPGTVVSDPFATSPVSCAPMAPCPCFMVSKTVWNGIAWVDEISDAQLGTTYRFRINVTSMCCDFTDLVVTDTLPGGLAYHGNAIPFAPAPIPPDTYQWTFPTLNKGVTQTIEFDVINNGYGCNLVNATAYCPDTGESCSGNDTACITAGRRDLEVTKIYINTDCYGLLGDQIFVNESNRIGAKIENNGPGDIAVGESFDVCFDANGVKIGCVNVTGGLAASEYKRIYIHWTPSCADYPDVMPGYPPTSMPVTINATVDCNCTGPGACPVCIGDGRIKEADEGNNKFSEVIPASKSGGRYVCGVVNNGYKSKKFDCTLTEEPLALFEYDQFYGGIEYNVSGRKYESFGPSFTDTRIHHIDIPPGMTIEKARLFVYWYDWSIEPGHLANLRVTFSGTPFTTLDAKYIDQKGFAWFNYPKGTYAYDVTSLVTAGSNDYTATVENIDPTHSTNLLGELLLVVYEDPSQDPNNHIQLWLMEGCDLLMGDAHFCVTPEEATATATFTGTAVSNPESAELITVVAQGMEPGSNMLFNGNIIKTNAWNAGSEAGPKTDWWHGSKINVEVVDVTSNMASSDNTVGFRDTGTAGMQASNAILVVKKEVPEPDLDVTEKFEEWVNETHFNINYTVCNIGTANAGACNTTIYLDGTAVMEDPVLALAAGESYTNTVGPFDCPCDQTLNITVCADNDDIVDESDETNNCKVNEVECPAGMPGIEVNKTVWDPETGQWVDEITACVCDIVRFRCEIHNSGTGCPLTNIEVIDILSDSLEYKNNATVDGELREPDWIAGNVFEWNFAGPLAPCETITIEFDAHVVECGVDINTQKAKAIDCYGATVFGEDTATVIGKPDLVVQKKVTIVDGAFIVNYTVTNQGCGPAGESKTCKFVDGEPMESQQCPALGSGESYHDAFEPEKCPCGETLNVTVCADNDDVIEECNETNNCEVNVVECPKLPDLVIDRMWTEGRRDRCKVYFVVKNIGCVPAPRDHYATLLVNDIPVEEKRVRKDLGPGEQCESSFKTTVSCAEDVIRVCADNTNVVHELYETNNCWPPMVEKPDLVIEDKWEEWTEEEGKYTVTYVVHNKGTVIAPGGHRTTLIVDGVAIEHKEVPVDLEYCQTYEDTFDAVIPCTDGSDIIKVCADNDGIIDEINEDNNCLQNEWSCEVVEKPDLVITNIETRERRGECKVSFVVKNDGTATAPRGHKATLFVNGIPVEEGRAVRRALMPGEEYNKGSFRTRVSCTDVIKVCADNLDVVDESDEDNNCLVL